MKDIVAKVGSYEKDGQTKNRYTKIGVIRENQYGEYLMLDPEINLAGVLIKQRLADPKAGGMVMCSIFDRDDSKQAQAAPRQSAPAADGFDDDVPF